ncbi:hypothetical protein INR49_012038 [Caranx melampygus]|nr:hypothetical protein INR49_012038 [Caranx melampygus]
MTQNHALGPPPPPPPPPPPHTHSKSIFSSDGQTHLSQLTSQSQTITLTSCRHAHTFLIIPLTTIGSGGETSTNSASHPLTFTIHQLPCSTHESHSRQRNNMSSSFFLLWGGGEMGGGAGEWRVSKPCLDWCLISLWSSVSVGLCS